MMAREFWMPADTPFNWSFVSERPYVTMINVSGKKWSEDKMRFQIYDGLIFPSSDNKFDICYSNSVIEHVGDQSRIELFAKEIRRSAPKYYVQTPNRRFFIEPHFVCLFIHWLPVSIKRRLIRYLSIWGWIMKPDQAHVDSALAGIDCLGAKTWNGCFRTLRLLLSGSWVCQNP